MPAEEFDRIAAEEWGRIPARFSERVENVALLVEDEPDEATRAREGLGPHETLLGLYHGIPAIERGAEYGVGGTLPDTITLYRLPILAEAAHTGGGEDAVRMVVRETLWHEVGHYFGFGEEAIREREDEGSNEFQP